jgi:thiamine biosynthesis lipoprotein
MLSAAADSRDADPPPGWTALGAHVQLVVTDPARLERGRAMLEADLAAMDAACSRLTGGSEIAALDGRAGGRVRVSPLLADAIAAALRTARLTDGDVDPTAGDVLAPPGGVLAPPGGVLAPPGGVLAPPGGAFSGALGVADGSFTARSGWQQVRLNVRTRLLWLPAGTRLDLGATVKAWAADRCAARLARTLRCGVLVGLGGDIAVAGKAPSGGWRIRVQDGTIQTGAGHDGHGHDGHGHDGHGHDGHGHDGTGHDGTGHDGTGHDGTGDAGTGHAGQAPAGGPVTVVAIRDGGLATASAAARRWRGPDVVHYLLDPRTGAPAAPFWRTVSVAAASCAFASAASTAAMIRGRRAKEWLATLRLPARLVGLDGHVYAVAGWPSAREPSPVG